MGTPFLDVYIPQYHPRIRNVIVNYVTVNYAEIKNVYFQMVFVCAFVGVVNVGLHSMGVGIMIDGSSSSSEYGTISLTTTSQPRVGDIVVVKVQSKSGHYEWRVGCHF